MSPKSKPVKKVLVDRHGGKTSLLELTRISPNKKPPRGHSPVLLMGQLDPSRNGLYYMPDKELAQLDKALGGTPPTKGKPRK